MLRVDGDVPPYVSELVAAAGKDAHTATTPCSRLGSAVGVAAVPSRTRQPPAGAIVIPPGTHELTVRYRLRETGMYGGAPFVEEWKPLSPRLHADVSEQHTIEIGHVAVAAVEVTGDDGIALDRADARRGARPRRVTRRQAAH